MAEIRERWSNRIVFLLAAIGSAVGLGNVWRFPYVCYQNGGGAFLIPYFVALITAGIPLMILEYGIGQMMDSSAPLSFAKIKERYEWVGWWALLIGFIVMAYYTVIMSWCFSYLIYSLDLNWGDSAQNFFFKNFLGLSAGHKYIGGIRLPIFLGLIVTWFCIFLCIIKGAKSVGKVVMITVPLPVICLGILVIRGLTLPGAMGGLKFYLTPNFKILLRPSVWLAAYSQVFFSLSLGFGVLIAYASYLPKKSDIVNNAFITSLADAGISFFAGFAVFSTLGYLAQSIGVGVKEVVTSGPGLAFVTYPTIIRLLPFGASFFGVLFFIMLLTLGIDSAFSLVEAVVAGGIDKWGISRKKANILVCIMAFLSGLIFTTQAGLYWIDVVDHFITNFGLVMIGLAECIIIGYVLGAEKIRKYINENSDFPIGTWWSILIKIVTPLILVVLILKSLWNEIKIPYEGYPQWVLFIGGWGVVVLAIIIAYLLMKMRAKNKETTITVASNQ